MIKIIKDDITTLKVDYIVNAANSSLLGGGGVDGAIHRVAGPKLLEQCQKIRREKWIDGMPVGEAEVVQGFNLPAKHVILTVGPNCYEITDKSLQTDLLFQTYFNVFTSALEHQKQNHNNIKPSIALPNISTGVYGFDKEEAYFVAVNVAQQFVADFSEIIFCCFDDENYNIYMNNIADYPIYELIEENETDQVVETPSSTVEIVTDNKQEETAQIYVNPKTGEIEVLENKTIEQPKPSLLNRILDTVGKWFVGILFLFILSGCVSVTQEQVDFCKTHAYKKGEVLWHKGLKKEVYFVDDTPCLCCSKLTIVFYQDGRKYQESELIALLEPITKDKVLENNTNETNDTTEYSKYFE